MAQTGYTPISIYYSATAAAAPTAGNLVAGELAINTNDGVLYYKDSGGVVQSIASKAGNSGSFTNLAYTGTLTGGTGVVNLGSGQFYKDASGNVGIGTTSPSTYGKLAVVNTAADTRISVVDDVSNNRGGYLRSNYSDAVILGTTSGVRSLVFSPDNTERMRIDGGNGIVTMSAYGAGAATFSASGVISSVSDETWKIKDGVPINPDAMLQKLEAGYWFYNEEKAPIFGKERQLGFYAQNVHEAIGEEAAPTPEEGKPWGYYDRSVLAVTVMSLKNALNTIQEQQALIESLTTRLTVLENK